MMTFAHALYLIVASLPVCFYLVFPCLSLSCLLTRFFRLSFSSLPFPVLLWFWPPYSSSSPPSFPLFHLWRGARGSTHSFMRELNLSAISSTSPISGRGPVDEHHGHAHSIVCASGGPPTVCGHQLHCVANVPIDAASPYGWKCHNLHG